ncbi:hypothetical protein AAP_06222 [Ascosphaera apis ARSEF 7405]|uniref:Cyclin PHO80-like protein n=1 Tax=Ascosphaera apis ARSEF 7405 TaxID=392613 RepID=A0A166MZ65_9EURO|nr:hypothetical protein AAP_06222 [Ascosphaera apis ARSEF 7405]
MSVSTAKCQYGMNSAGHYNAAHQRPFYGHTNSFPQTKPTQQLPNINVSFTSNKPYKSSRSRSTMSSSISSLTDIAASISCLLWFETNAKIAVIEKLESLHGSVPPMIREAAPTRQFRSWLYTVLTTTQVSRNVVYLALLFVYRLKRTIPCPRGRKGNLDDNTYTNKTWADVCGMNVEELHQMEMELLRSLRYKLFVSESEWHRWEDKVILFKTYSDKAIMLPFEELQHSPAPSLPSPYYYNGPSPVLPQLPNSNSQSQPQPQPQPHANGNGNAKLPRSASMAAHVAEPTRLLNDVFASLQHPHACGKQTHLGPLPQPTTSTSTMLNGGYTPAYNSLNSLQLNTPNDTNPNFPPWYTQKLPQPAPPLQQQTLVQSSLAPPLNTHSAPTYIPQLPPPPHSTTRHPSTEAAYSLPSPSFQAPTSSANSIPRNSPYGPAPSAPAPAPALQQHHQHQPSALLYAPGTNVAHHARALPFDQLHYQPLSKASNTERRTGLLPYLYPEGWNHQQAAAAAAAAATGSGPAPILPPQSY